MSQKGRKSHPRRHLVSQVRQGAKSEGDTMFQPSESSKSNRKVERHEKLVDTLNKGIVIDIFFFLVPLAIFTVIYQTTFIQSAEADISRFGLMAVSLGLLGALGVGLTVLFYGAKYINFESTGRERPTKLEKPIMKEIKEKNGMFDFELKEVFKERMEAAILESTIRDLFKKGLIAREKESHENRDLFKNYAIPKRSFMGLDDDFTEDYTKTFIIILALQVGFSLVYGGFTGSAINLEFSWDINTLLLPINAAVMEELLFSLWLSTFLLVLIGSMRNPKLAYVFVAMVINCIGFLIIHYIVYGTNPEALLYVVVLRALYFYAYYKTRRPSIPILLHMINNFIYVQSILFINITFTFLPLLFTL